MPGWDQVARCQAGPLRTLEADLPLESANPEPSRRFGIFLSVAADLNNHISDVFQAEL